MPTPDGSQKLKSTAPPIETGFYAKFPGADQKKL
jgi:hypothetical protein